MSASGAPAPTAAQLSAASRRRALAAMLGVVIIWGVNVSVMKAALAEVTPYVFNALRFPLGAAVLALLVLRLEREPWPRPTEWVPLGVLALSAHPVYQLCFLNGLALTSASHAAVIVSTTPVWVALADRVVQHERLPAAAWGGIGVSLIGVGVITFAHGGGGGSSVGGDFLVLASSVIWTFYVIRSRPMLYRRSPLWVTAWALFLGMPFMVAMGIPDLLRLDPTRIGSAVWGGAVYAGLLALATAYSWWALGVKVLGASRTAIFSNLIPVVALLVAWAWLGETLSALAWAGAALALAGVWLTTVTRAPWRAAQR